MNRVQTMDIQRDTERRQKPRNAVDRIAFIQMADGNSGTILDVSETGLRFRTVAPIAENGPVEFWYSMNLSDRVEASGEVVWRDATKKEGGLCFRDGSASAAVQNGRTRREAEQMKAATGTGGFAVLGAIPEMPAAAKTRPLAAVADAAGSNAERDAEKPSSGPVQRKKPQWKIELEEALERRRAADSLHAAKGEESSREVEQEPQETIADTKEPDEATASTSRPPQGIPPIPAELFAKIAAREHERFFMPTLEPATGSGWPFVKGIFAGMVATAAIVALGFYYLGLRQERVAVQDPQQIDKARATEPAENPPADNEGVQNPAGAAGVLPQNSAPAAAGSVAPDPATARDVPAGKTTDSSLTAKGIPRAGSAATPGLAAGTRGAATAALPGGTTDRAASPANAQQKMAENGVAPAAAAKSKTLLPGPHTPTELWMEVAAGNTSAQIMLAEMYATGDGVGKNCEQARVLLKTAAAKGNADAIRKYDTINTTSCK